jgi:hypothetical protein
MSPVNASIMIVVDTLILVAEIVVGGMIVPEAAKAAVVLLRPCHEAMDPTDRTVVAVAADTMLPPCPLAMTNTVLAEGIGPQLDFAMIPARETQISVVTGGCLRSDTTVLATIVAAVDLGLDLLLVVVVGVVDTVPEAPLLASKDVTKTSATGVHHPNRED